MILAAIILFFTGVYLSNIHRSTIQTTNKHLQTMTFSVVFPIMFLSTGLLQTIWIMLPFFKKRPKNAKKRELRFELEDGTTIIVDEYITEPTNMNEESHLDEEKVKFAPGKLDTLKNNTLLTNNPNSLKNLNIIILHGLHGTSDSAYVLLAAKLFVAKGARVFCVNSRGMKGRLFSNEFSHAGHTEDLHRITKYILDTHDGPVVVLGFSQGANVVTKFITEIDETDQTSLNYDHRRVIGGISVCNPFNLRKCQLEALAGGITGRLGHSVVSFLFKRHIHSVVCRSGCTKKKLIYNLASGIERDNYTDDVNKELICQTISNSSNPYETMKCLVDLGLINKGQVKDVDEFLRECSSEYYISKITKPFLFINALDDPVIPKSVIPVGEILKNEKTGLITLRGGQLGFTNALMNNTLDKIFLEFIERIQFKDK